MTTTTHSHKHWTSKGGHVNLIETAKSHIRAKVEHLFRVIKQQFGFQKTQLHRLAKNRCKIMCW